MGTDFASFPMHDLNIKNRKERNREKREMVIIKIPQE